MTIPPDSVLRTLDYDGLTALAEADATIDVPGSIARVRELLERGPSIEELRDPRSLAPDPTKRPITAQRAALVAAHAATPNGRHLAALRQNGTRS